MQKSNSEISKILEKISGSFMNNPEAAFNELQHLEENYSEILTPVHLIELKFRQAQIENVLGRFQDAEKKLSELLAKVENNEIILIKVINELGNNFLAQNRLEEATELFLKCLNLLEKRKDYAKMCVPLNNIGQIYWINKNYEKAKEYYNRSLQLANKYDPSYSGDNYTNLGILAAEEGDFQEAEKNYLNAQKVYEEIGDEARKPLLYVNLALLYQDQKKYEQADNYHNLAFEGFRESSNLFGEMYAATNYAGYLISIDKFDKVESLLKRSVELADLLNSENQYIQIYDHYHNYYSKTRKYKKAYLYMQLYHQAETKRMESDQKEKITEVLTKYETEQKEKEANLLREKNHQIEKQKKQLDIANNKLKKANLELEKRLEELLGKWHQETLMNKSRENLNGLVTIVSGITHQWKQPVNVIGLVTQNLIDAYTYDEFSEEILKNYIDQIKSQLDYMNGIINDFARDFKTMQSNSSFHFAHTLSIIRKLLGKTLVLENIKSLFNSEENIVIRGSETEFIQVMMIIISNAVEVYKEYRIENPFISIEAKKINEKTVIICKNTGPNIESEYLSQIFMPFFTTKEDNTGLGLALAQKIITENFKGKIKVKNLKDGVEFNITIPFWETSD